MKSLSCVELLYSRSHYTEEYKQSFLPHPPIPKYLTATPQITKQRLILNAWLLAQAYY